MVLLTIIFLVAVLIDLVRLFRPALHLHLGGKYVRAVRDGCVCRIPLSQFEKKGCFLFMVGDRGMELPFSFIPHRNSEGARIRRKGLPFFLLSSLTLWSIAVAVVYHFFIVPYLIDTSAERCFQQANRSETVISCLSDEQHRMQYTRHYREKGSDTGYNLLLIGGDSRQNNRLGLADMLILVHIDDADIKVISLQRDLCVEQINPFLAGPQENMDSAFYEDIKDTITVYPDYITADIAKLNECGTQDRDLGEFGELRDAAGIHSCARSLVINVEKAVDIYIDAYMCINMAGFKALIDGLGGMTLNVTEEMVNASSGALSYQNRLYRSDSELHEGTCHLGGNELLAIIRSRYDEADGSAAARSTKAQDILVTFCKQKAVEIAARPSLLNEYLDSGCLNNIYTDMEKSGLELLTNLFRDPEKLRLSFGSTLPQAAHYENLILDGKNYVITGRFQSADLQYLELIG